MQKIIYIIISNILVITAYCQGPVPFIYENSFTIQSVKSCSPSFPLTSGWVRMKEDNGSYISSTNNTLTVYDEYGSTIRPTTYISDYRAQFEGVISVETCGAELPDDPIYIQAVNENGYNLPIQEGDYDSDNNTFLYDNEHVVKKFDQSVVLFYKDFKLDWYVSNNENDPLEDWTYAGSSSFPLYVLHDDPLLYTANNHSEETQALNSLIHLSCKKANGLSSTSEIIEAVWNIFDINVPIIRPVDLEGDNQSDFLKYGVQTGCVSTSVLLTGFEGRCEAFANLFDDMLRVHGINEAECKKVFWKPDGELPTTPYLSLMQNDAESFFSADVEIGFKSSPAEAVFLVENWNIADLISGFALDPSAYSLDDSPLIISGSNNDLTWREVLGVSGMGNINPISEFVDHMVVESGNELYDPSYGVKFTSHPDWEESSISCFGSLVSGELNGNFFTAVWIHQNNDSVLQTTIE